MADNSKKGSRPFNQNQSQIADSFQIKGRAIEASDQLESNIVDKKQFFVNLIGQKCKRFVNQGKKSDTLMQKFMEDVWKSKMIEKVGNASENLKPQELIQLAQSNWNVVYRRHKEQMREDFFKEVDPAQLQDQLNELQAQFKLLQEKK